MARDLRFVPPGSLVEVTSRTLQARFLLKPNPDLNAIVIGVLAKAQKRYGMTVCAFVYLSNHCHLLLQPRDAQQLARFMNYVNGNIAKEAGRLYHWREKFWGRRFRAIVVSNEPEVELSRLTYLYSQGCKEGLVDSPRSWPGATSAKARDRRLTGVWFDRTAEYRARRRGEDVPKMRFAETLELVLTPIPSWQDLPDHRADARQRALLREIEATTRRALAEAHKQPLGIRAILGQAPQAAPRHSKRSPAPRFHVHRGYVRRQLEAAYSEFVYSYQEAKKRMLEGKKAFWPPGSFVPSRGFVGLPA